MKKYPGIQTSKVYDDGDYYMKETLLGDIWKSARNHMERVTKLTYLERLRQGMLGPD